MARTYTQISIRTGLAVADSALPSAPTDNQGNPVSTLPAGVISSAGAYSLIVDVLAPNTATGNTSVLPFAWNHRLNAWSQVGSAQTVAVATQYSSGTGVVAQRVQFTNWASDYAFVAVTALATNGGAGVGTAVSTVAVLQDK